MWSSRDRARREHAPAQHQNRTDTRSDSRSDNRSDLRRPFKRTRAANPPPSEHNRKRFRQHPYGPHAGSDTLHPGSVGSSSRKVSSEALASAPRLSELRNTRRSSSDWPWDVHANGYENVSAQALKLLGYATPESTYSSSNVPEEIVKIRSTKPLKVGMSWLMCQVGTELHDSPRKAAEAFSKHEGERPANARFVLEHEQSEDLFTDIEAIVVRDVSSQQEIEARYKAPILHSETLSTGDFVVKFHSPPEAPLSGDTWLFPQQAPINPVVEVLNAFPLANPNAPGVLKTLSDLCTKIGYAVANVWRSEGNLPYRVPRVYIELQNLEETHNAASELGNMKLQGRPLVTTLSFGVTRPQRSSGN